MRFGQMFAPAARIIRVDVLAEIAALDGVQSERTAGDTLAPDGRLDPRRVAEELGDMLPEDTVVVQDGGHFVGWSNTYWRFSDPSQMVMIGAAIQAVGQGFHGAAGVARARPEAFIVGSTMHIREPDFAGIARALGAQGLTVSRIEDLDEVRDWLRVGGDGVMLIDGRISGNIIAPYFQEIRDSHQ